MESTAKTQPVATHTATLGGETVEMHAANFSEVMDALMERHPGAGVPSVEAIQQLAEVVPINRTTSFASRDEEVVTPEGKERAERDERMARENGFAVKPPLYAIGTQVNQWGVDNAKQSQLEHQAKPSARDVCHGLRQQVRDERREDIGPVKLADTRLTLSGSLAVGEVGLDGKFVEQERFGVEEPGFRRLASRC